MYPRRLLIILGLAAFLGSLVVYAPVRLALRLLPDTSPLHTAEAGGRVGDGYVRVVDGNGQPAIWRWQLQPAWLLTLGLVGDWTVDGSGLRASGRFSLRPWGYRVNMASGELSAQRLARLAGAAGLAADKPLALHDLSLSGMPGKAPANVNGTLSWGPGDVRVNTRSDPLAVPALRGRLETREGIVHLLVDGEREPGAALLTASWDPQSGALQAAVLVRAAELLGVAGEHQGQAPDKPFIELRQTLR